jgi:RHS repeat-associated protein
MFDHFQFSTFNFQFIKKTFTFRLSTFLLPLQYQIPLIMKTLRYFYHPDHLGSSSVSTPLNNHWITYGSGNAIQHLHYLLLKSFAFFPPWRSVKKIYFLYTHCLRRFGEDWVDQRNGSWSAPYTFSGKEKDVETGYSYFGARYYDSGLSIWLSVDPMSDKYPNLTPYNYCANNPVILVDPDGREVEYNSNIDIIIVAAFRLVNSKFDSYVKTLENSDELYTFNYNEDGKNSFGYDGRSLIISYSLTDALSEEGATINSLLMHETEHAMQFEHGEIGFSRNDLNGNPLPDGGWRPIGYDLTDEWKAHDAEFRSIQDFNGPRNVTNLWGKKERESFRSNPVMTKWDQLIYLKLNERYFDLPLGPINAPKNLNETVKNNQTYIKPYKQR